MSSFAGSTEAVFKTLEKEFQELERYDELLVATNPSSFSGNETGSGDVQYLSSGAGRHFQRLPCLRSTRQACSLKKDRDVWDRLVPHPPTHRSIAFMLYIFMCITFSPLWSSGASHFLRSN